MQGYCSKCKDQVEMTGVFTDKLPNGRFVNKGRCLICSDPVWKTIKDNEIIVSKSGRHYPSVVYIGKFTPKKIINQDVGQMNVKDGVVSGNVFTDAFKAEGNKLLKEIKEEAGIYEKETFITR